MGEVLVSLGTRGCLIYFACSSFLAALVHILAGLLPTDTVQACVCIAPLLEAYLYRRATKGRRSSMPRGSSTIAQPLPVSVIMLGIFFGFSFGVMRGFSNSPDTDPVSFRDIVSMGSVMAACLIAYLVAIVRLGSFGNLVYNVALPLVALGFLLLPLSGALSLAGLAAYRLGYQYVYIILWGLWVFCATKTTSSAVWVVSCGLATVQVSKLAGYLVSSNAAAHLQSSLNMGVVSSVCLFVIVLFAIFSKNNGIDPGSWEEVKPATRVPVSPPSPEQAYAAAAELFGLSPREEQVFFLILKGRSRPHIAKELNVAEETVKSHVKGIYQKAGVHSKQSLIDRVEAISQVMREEV